MSQSSVEIILRPDKEEHALYLIRGEYKLFPGCAFLPGAIHETSQSTRKRSTSIS